MKMFARTGIAGLVLGASLAIAGCKTAGHQQVDETSTRLTQLGSNAEALKAQLSATASALDGLLQKADSDPKPALDTFTTSARASENAYNAVQTRVTGVQSESDKMFKAWAENAKKISDPDLQKLSADRRAALGKSIEDVMKATQPALDDTKAFLATTGDLVKYLTQDLTPDGIRGTKGKSSALAKSAASIGDKLDAISKAASKAAAEFATAKPTEKPATSGGS